MGDLDVLVAVLSALRQRDDVVDGEIPRDRLAADAADASIALPDG